MLKNIICFLTGFNKSDQDNFEEFQKNRKPSMKIIGRGTLTMSLEDAHKARIENSKHGVN